MSFFSDFFNLAFRSGVPYDTEKNRFLVGPAEAARIEWQRQQEEEINLLINHPIRPIDDQF